MFNSCDILFFSLSVSYAEDKILQQAIVGLYDYYVSDKQKKPATGKKHFPTASF